MPVKAIPAAVLGKQSAHQAEVVATAVAAALAAALKPSLDALATDKTDRHAVANSAQSAVLVSHEALELAKVNESRISGLDKRMDSLMGDGTGRNGAIAEMDRNIDEVKGDVREVKRDMKTLLENSEKSKSFMSGWGGAKMTLVIMGLLVTLVGGLVAILVRLK